MKLIKTGKPAGAVLAMLAGVAVAYFGFLRRWHMTWGATAQAAGGQVAGDELMPDADIVATRVVEIDAPPGAIWPWLVRPVSGQPLRSLRSGKPASWHHRNGSTTARGSRIHSLMIPQRHAE